MLKKFSTVCDAIIAQFLFIELAAQVNLAQNPILFADVDYFHRNDQITNKN